MEIHREDDALLVTAKGLPARYITLDDDGCATLDKEEPFGPDSTAAIISLAADPAERAEQVRAIAKWL